MACTIFKRILIPVIIPALSKNQRTIFYSGKATQELKNEKDEKREKAEKAKKLKTYISLIGIDKSRSYMTLEEAQKLSNRRGFKLVKLDEYDKKKECPIYQLYTGAQYLMEDIQSKKSKSAKAAGFKGEKIITFSNTISEHDASSKVKQIIKWLDKYHEVRVTISGSEPQDKKAEKVCEMVETLVGQKGRILQKRTKGNDIKFQLIPPKKKDDKTDEVST